MSDIGHPNAAVTLLLRCEIHLNIQRACENGTKYPFITAALFRHNVVTQNSLSKRRSATTTPHKHKGHEHDTMRSLSGFLCWLIEDCLNIVKSIMHGDVFLCFLVCGDGDDYGDAAEKSAIVTSLIPAQHDVISAKCAFSSGSILLIEDGFVMKVPTRMAVPVLIFCWRSVFLCRRFYTCVKEWSELRSGVGSRDGGRGFWKYISLHLW